MLLGSSDFVFMPSLYIETHILPFKVRKLLSVPSNNVPACLFWFFSFFSFCHFCYLQIKFFINCSSDFVQIWLVDL